MSDGPAVSSVLGRPRKPPAQTRRTFLKGHAKEILSIDFFTVPTATLKVLYMFLVLSHERRRVVHVNVTDAPAAVWIAGQIVQAFPWDTAPRSLRECLDHVILLNEKHLGRVLREHLDYYSRGQVIAIPQVGALHHRCTRKAA